MSVISAALRELMAAGLSGDALLAAIERIEAASVTARDEITPAERKKQLSRERSARYRETHKRDDGVTMRDAKTPSSPALPPSSFPLTLPLITTPNPPPPPKPSLRSDSSKIRKTENFPADAKELFWEIYPPYRKTDKRKAFEKIDRIDASGVVPWDDFWAGLQRYVASDPGEYAKGPVPWLNSQGWLGTYKVAAAKNQPLSLVDIARGNFGGK